MRTFIVKILILAACMLAIDFAAGLLFSYLIANAKGGDSGRNNYICDKTKEEILVFGSSRGIRHYNSQIMMDSLGMTCYNCGQNGNGIILNFGRYQMIHQRYTPKFVVYDIYPEFDLKSGDNHKYLKWLKAYYDRDGIPEIFQDVDDTERYKMVSNLYRYNSNFVQIVSDCVRPMQSLGTCGYRPLTGEMDTLKISKAKNASPVDIEFDPLKLECWEKFLNLTSGSQLIFVISPTWGGMAPANYKPIETIAEQRGIPFINFANNPKYMGHAEYFWDGGHLNSRGADEFTKDLVGELKKFTGMKH